MIISYFQTSDNSAAENLSKRENVYVDLCSSVLPFSTREKGSLLLALIKQKKISILLASHNMEEVKRLCTSVMMMKNGKIIDRGAPSELIKKHGRKNLEEVFLKLAREKNEF